MNRYQFEVAPGTHLAHRFFWLVVVPTGSCFGTWAMATIGSHRPLSALVIAALLPWIGLITPVAYRWLTRDLVRLLPYLPVALMVAVFTPTTIDLAIAISREPDGAFIPVVPFGLGFLLPFVTFGCGMSSFILVEPRSRV